ncbi:S49 family peptidase [Actinopolyspora mortivallis]|uniref:S49 family peptidase n=1 Tax=Actinopolyspora mortivallis TaxID=33906 RepID=A0A2T0GW22_ACTMO|nr:S49 family peptidase [Actinopolyspora mortivallis]PRW63310.1 S49 family peptidase [Actinopolyspora mortivallis]
MSDKPAQKLAGTLSDKVSRKLPGKLAERAERGPVVPVIKLHGPITPMPSPVNRPSISLQTVESALNRAFSFDRLSAVALSVNSPGGAATQSALVAERVRELAEDKDVPVLAFCEDVAASGGYWLACAGDEIYAHASSMVGSVGVLSAGFGLDELLRRAGIERRVHTAGEHKSRLDPFRPEDPEDVQWLQGMQRELHAQFADWVRGRRGEAVSGADEDLFSGEVWTGRRAAELGLVDGLGTLRGVVSRRFPEAHVVSVEPRKPLLARLGVAGPTGGASGLFAGAVDAVLDRVEHRAMWSRFGL